MPVVLSKDFHKDLDVDGSLKAKAWDFVRKLSADPGRTGLDLKSPQGALDKRVRTARVDLSYRAVLFDMGMNGEPFYLLAAIKQHDDAYALAERIELRVNPVNGIAEVLRRDEMRQALRTESETADGPTRTVDPERPRLLPFSVAELTGLGILAEVAERAIEITDEDELQELCLAVPEWQGDALLQLGYGTSLDDVRKLYEPPERATGEADFGKAFEHPASRMQFVVVTEDDDTELRAMLEGDFRHWRTFLHPEQRAVAYRERWNGSFRLSGGAGTGKTVVAIHRAAFLAEADPSRRVLLTTFTKMLASQLEADLAQLAGPGRVSRGVGPAEPGTVRVTGIDSLARAIVVKIDGQVPRIISPQEEDLLWENVVTDLPDLTPKEAEMLTPSLLKAEYRNVILAQEITTEQQYLKAPRRGRGVRMNWFQRGRVWEAVEMFRQRLDVEGKTTFTALVARAAQLLTDASVRDRVDAFDHVIVDEGQDLHATHWRLLRRLAAKGPNDLFICEDSHQRIYGERLVLSHFDIDVRGRSRKLTLNYRTTRENLRFALGILDDAEVVDLDGGAEDRHGYRSRLSGPRPLPHESTSAEDEFRYVARTVAGWLAEPDDTRPDAESVAVLARTRKQCEDLAGELRALGVPVEMLAAEAQPANPAVRVATMHRAKGTEFARVVVAGVSDADLPSRWLLDNAPDGDHADIEARERLLLYVACTRARDQLVVSWHGSPSRFVPLPP